jgi:hypothetical protein
MPKLPVLTDGLRLGSIDFSEVIAVFESAANNRDQTGGEIVIELYDVLEALGRQPDIELPLTGETQQNVQDMCVAIAKVCGFDVKAPVDYVDEPWRIILS